MQSSFKTLISLFFVLCASCALGDTLGALSRIVHDKVPITINAEARTVTMPLLLGKTKAKHNAWYILTEASDPGVAKALGVNYSPKLALLDNDVVKPAYVSPYGFLHFEQGSNLTFHPQRAFAFRDSANTRRSRFGHEELRFFPPSSATPGSSGDVDYTPFVQLKEALTVVLNAPIIAAIGSNDLDLIRANQNLNRSILHDRVLSIDPIVGVVTLQAEVAFVENRRILYLPMDSSDAGIAALEKATFAPRLKKVGINVPSERYHYMTFDVTEKAAFIVTKHTLSEDLGHQGWEAQMESLRNDTKMSAQEEGSYPVFESTPCTAQHYSPLLDIHIVENNSAKVKLENKTKSADGVKSWGEIKSRIASDDFIGVRGTIFGSSGIVTNAPSFPLDSCETFLEKGN